MSRILLLLLLFLATLSCGDQVQDQHPDGCLADGSVPVAIARLRAQDVSDPDAPYTPSSTVTSQTRVYLDGRASHAVPDCLAVTAFEWTLASYPPTADPSSFALEGQGTELASFVAADAGEYEVMLLVTDENGVRSAQIDDSRVIITCE